jgi:hypothetical protein
VRARLAVLLTLILVAGLAPAARAATRVGPPSLATSGLTNFECPGNRCTYIQYTDNGATPAYVSPMSGVITRWELASGSQGNEVRLRVLRPREPAGSFSGQGTSLRRVTEGGLNTFTGERVAVETGDSIGIDDGAGLFYTTGVSNALVRQWSPFLADAGGSSAPQDSRAGYSLQMHADIEPDADGDRFGDETQDGCPGDNQRNAPPCGRGPVNPIRPIVTRLRASPSTLRIGGRSSISFRISAVARWTLTFEQKRSGRIRNGKCRRNLHSGRRCTVYTRRGSVSGSGGPGGVTLVFQGALANRRSLPVGRYRVTATARNADGTSKPVRISLRLLPKRR